MEGCVSRNEGGTLAIFVGGLRHVRQGSGLAPVASSKHDVPFG